MSDKGTRLSRREMLKFSSTLLAAAAVAACGATPTATPVPPTATPVPPTKAPVPPTAAPVPPTATKPAAAATAAPAAPTAVPPTAVPPTPTAAAVAMVPAAGAATKTGAFTFASHNEGEARKNTTTAFFAKYYPKMTFSHDITPGLDTFILKIQAQIAGGTPPDVMLQHESRILGFSAMGLLLPLDEMHAARPMAGKVEDYLGLVERRYKGKTYGWPSTHSNMHAVYNKTVLQKAGIPFPTDDWQYKDLLAMAKKSMGAADFWGWAAQWDDPGWLPGWYPLLKSFGGETFNDDDTACTLNTPEGIQTLEFIREAWTSKTVPTPAINKQTGSDAMFNAQRAAFLTRNTSDFRALEDVATKNNWDYGLVTVPGGPKGHFCRVGGSSYAIPKGSKFPDVAWDLMRFMQGDPEGVQIGYEKDIVDSGNVTYFKKYAFAVNEKIINSRLKNWTTVAVDSTAKYRTAVRYSKIGVTFSPMVTAEMAALADGSKTAAEVAKRITDQANQMLKDFKPV